MNAMDTVRLNLDSSELRMLESIINDADIKIYAGEYQSMIDVFNSLKEKIGNPIVIEYSSKKVDATVTATEARTAKAKAKIKETFKQLERDFKRGYIKKISYYAISKKSGVHINTVKKYITLDEVKV